MTDADLERERAILEAQSSILEALEPLQETQRVRVIRAVLAMHGYPLPPDRRLEREPEPEKGGGQ